MRGTSRYSREQLSDEFSKLKMNGGPSSFQTTRQNIGAAIRLSAHVLREPFFPANEFEQLKKLMLTSYEMALSDPASKASEALTPEQMLEALRKHIDPSKLTIVKAGDFAKP